MAEQPAQPAPAQSVSGVSPVIKKTELTEQAKMSFPDAIQKVKEGLKVTKLSWNNPDYLIFKDDWVKIYRAENKLFHQFIICGIDLLDNDWVEVK